MSVAYVGSLYFPAKFGDLPAAKDVAKDVLCPAMEKEFSKYFDMALKAGFKSEDYENLKDAFEKVDCKVEQDELYLYFYFKDTDLNYLCRGLVYDFLEKLVEMDGSFGDILLDFVSSVVFDIYPKFGNLEMLKESRSLSKKNLVDQILEGVDVRKVLSGDHIGSVVCEADGAFDRKSFMKEVANNSINKKIKQIADKYGYTAGETYLRWYGGIQCRINAKDRNSYHPDVYVDTDFDIDETATIDFRIQTTAYGSIAIGDYQEFLKCCEDAYKMLSEINKLDLTKLAREPKEAQEF